MQQAIGIDRENGADGIGRQRLGAAAQQIGHRDKRLAARNRLQHLCLETQQQTGIARDHSGASNPDGKPIGGK